MRVGFGMMLLPIQAGNKYQTEEVEMSLVLWGIGGPFRDWREIYHWMKGK